MEQDLLRRQVKTPKEDPIIALKAELKAHKKTISKLQSQYTKGGGGGNGKTACGKQQKKGKKDSTYVPFPTELKTKPAPSDASKPVVIDGIEYWYCAKHKKWGKHSTSVCKKDTPGESKQDKPQSSDGDRQGRVVRALKAIVI